MRQRREYLFKLPKPFRKWMEYIPGLPERPRKLKECLLKLLPRKWKDRLARLLELPRKWKDRLPRLPELPRKWKIVRNLCFSALALLLTYVFAGAPVFSAKQAFLREERRYFIGPSRIIAVLDAGDESYDKLVIAHDGDAVILCPVYESNHIKRLHYKKKTGDATVLAAPTDSWFSDINQVLVVLFDEVPEAARAVLSLSLHSEVNGVEYEGDYVLESEREYENCFLFTLRPVCSDYRAEAELYAFVTLQKMTDDWYSFSDIFPARVSFYDAKGGLISEIELLLTSTY
jgi:hypothetical protein